MSVSSTSTRAELEAAIGANLDYEINASASEARELRAACTYWLLKTPTQSTAGGTGVNYDPAYVRELCTRVTAWLQGSAGSPSVTGCAHYEFGEFGR